MSLESTHRLEKQRVVAGRMGQLMGPLNEAFARAPLPMKGKLKGNYSVKESRQGCQKKVWPNERGKPPSRRRALTSQIALRVHSSSRHRRGTSRVKGIGGSHTCTWPASIQKRAAPPCNPTNFPFSRGSRPDEGRNILPAVRNSAAPSPFAALNLSQNHQGKAGCPKKNKTQEGKKDAAPPKRGRRSNRHRGYRS